MDPITVITVGASVLTGAYKLWAYFHSPKKITPGGEEDDDSSSSPMDRLEVSSERCTQLDHLSVTQVKGRLELSQVGEFGVIVPRTRTRRPRALNTLCGCLPRKRRRRGVR